MFEENYKDLENAGFNMILKFVDMLDQNIQNREMPTLDIITCINSYFSLFILYETFLAPYIDNANDEDFITYARQLQIFFLFGFSIYQSIISLIILRFSNQVDSTCLILRSIVEKIGLFQHLIVNSSDFESWKEGKKRIIMSGKNGVLIKMFNKEYIESKMQRKINLNIDPKYADTLEILYTTFSQIVHSRASELSTFMRIWKEKSNYSDSVPLMDEFYTNTAHSFSKEFLVVTDILALTLTYNAYIMTKGRLFEKNTHINKISELLNTFPETKRIFRKALGESYSQ